MNYNSNERNRRKLKLLCCFDVIRHLHYSRSSTTLSRSNLESSVNISWNAKTIHKIIKKFTLKCGRFIKE